ncbi:MAG TPA: PAS domain S-box protein [Syntrophales bacterium]|nr:PAS domain S-box protein [Syntrophales bacterium]
MGKQLKTKKQLTDELAVMRQRVAELENLEVCHNQDAHSAHQLTARLNAVIQAFEGLIYVCSQDYRIKFMNEQLINRTGYDATGELCYRVLHDRDSICPWCVNERVFAGETVRWEVKSPKDNRWYYVANTPVYNEDGTVDKQAMIQDITDRKLVEQALLACSEKKYRELIESANSIILRIDNAGNVTFFNEFAQHFFGYKEDEILGRNVVGTITPEVESTGRDLRWMIQDIGLNPECYVNNINENIRRNGKRVWIAWTNKPIFDANGQVAEILCIGNDITDRKRLEEIIQKSEATLRGILRAAPIGIGIVTDRIFGWINDQITTMVGYTSEELLGQTARMLYESDEEYDRVGKITYANIREKGTGSIKTRWKTKDGTLIDIYLNSAPIYANDLSAGVIFTAMDVTDRRQAEEALLKSEKYFKAITENSSDIILIVDKKGTLTYASPSVERLLGYKQEELIGKSGFDFIMPVDIPRAIHDFSQAVLTKKNVIPNSFRVKRKDGTECILEGVGNNLLDNPSVEGFVMNVRDVTARKQAEEALRNSEIRFGDIADNAAEWVWEVNAQGKYTYSSSVVEQLLGFTPKEILDKYFYDLFHPDDREELSKAAFEVFTNKKPFRDFLNRNLHKNGQTVWLSTSGAPILDENGNLTGYRGADIDITERKQAEDALRKSEEKYRLSFENISDVIYTIDKNLKLSSVSPSVERALGYKAEELLNRPFQELNILSPKSLEEAISSVALVFSGKQIPATIYEFIAKDGTKKFGEIIATPLRTGDTIAGIIGVARDITERKRVEEALQHSEERFSKAFNMSPYPTSISTIDTGLFIDANDSFLNMIGYRCDEVIGYTAAELSIWTNWDDRKYLSQKISEQGFLREEFIHLVTKKREIRDLLLSSEIITLNGEKFVLSIFYDITEQKKLEAQIRRADKIQAIGTLAGGIAHDFNNILSAIMGYTDMALSEHEMNDELRRYLEQVFKAGKRARDLVKQILTFSRQSEEIPHPLRISPIIREVLKLLRASLPSTINIHHNIQSEPDIVLADPTHIHQILMNLCTNAAYAMREKKGDLKVSLAPAEISKGDILTNHDLIPGKYLKLTVSDTGCGIDPSIIDRIFDPFFTTKKPGEGTGMGLSVVHGILKSYGGTITVDSEVGRGTDFHIYMPLLADIEAEQDEQEAEDIPGGKESILFVDDEEVIVQIGKFMLTDLGYKFVGKTDSLEALNLFRSQPEQFDLVITDMTMPNMTGIELARELMLIRPNIPIILCTGFSEAITSESAKAIGLKDFILKPIVKSQIASAIRHALEHK